MRFSVLVVQRQRVVGAANQIGANDFPKGIQRRQILQDPDAGIQQLTGRTVAVSTHSGNTGSASSTLVIRFRLPGQLGSNEQLPARARVESRACCTCSEVRTPRRTT